MKSNLTKKVRILAVDDEPEILHLYRNSISLMSKKSGSEDEFEVTLCTQGDEALDAVRAAGRNHDPYAVVFLDLKLPPGPDGIWTGEQIRKLDPFVNFVIVTGLQNADAREVAHRIPPDDKILYIQKPFHLQEIWQFTIALSAKWKSEILLRNANAELEKKVKELESNRKELMKNKSELENVNNQLMETNDALSVLARNLDKTRKESEKRVLQRTKTLIIPIVERLHQDKNLERYRPDLDQLVGFLENLTSDLANDLKIAGSLSGTELRIASLVKSGMSSEEIAGHLYISLSTVKTHRKNIRRKLNLRNSKISLKAYLRSQLGE